MFSFFKRKKSPEAAPPDDKAPLDGGHDAPGAGPDAPAPAAPDAGQAQAEALRQEQAERLEAERVQAEQAQAARAAAERAELERAEAARLEAEKAEAARVEAERLEAERLEAERIETARLEAERLDAERAEAERIEAERLEAERARAAEAEKAQAAPPSKSSWLSRLTSGLSRTGQNISSLFVGVKVDEALFEELETALIMADAGVEATEKLLAALRARVRKEKIADAALVKAALRDLLAEHLAPLEKDFPIDRAAPLVVMIAGVNGAGKTTSIGKLANAFQRQGKSVLLAAGDTFRAAAREQLIAWGTRNNVTVIAQDGGDPAAVAFDAVNAGRARSADVVMVDTAGRLPTQLHLMEELKKIKRVIGKADGQAPHEVLLVVDGNTGQNAISQIRAFDAAIELTGLVVTKLDGTAKGGALAAVAAGSQGVRPVPVYWIGVGEGLEDLQPFVAREFATAVVGE
ncbi:signal recognition particle-docking protein FtsY [Pusillimonas noertemannii]|uniref:Signal recognition particle receptor FtsY n=1 Tax=Pusillimonas noertemannii TaxID=305977 RepID=A0A2U1CLW1_9BURK|nr:signal recognition particle-docking protein FtsY [Pusillimonas noertemannii]NYT68993.1 signal recognition particle-docking protein FtsY [Pusillimonas noertemannii]PVY61987.1 fused signal recognition particle receptor [Pusillimonas noertemannii]TFL11005.1 signal recognition particle-docking protein FtsY [Pusillimonas noertemannii]